MKESLNTWAWDVHILEYFSGLSGQSTACHAAKQATRFWRSSYVDIISITIGAISATSIEFQIITSRQHVPTRSTRSCDSVFRRNLRMDQVPGVYRFSGFHLQVIQVVQVITVY